MSLANQLKIVNKKIVDAAASSHRKTSDVQLIAVSKTFSTELIREAYKAGQRIFAENYVNEASNKLEELSDLKLEWHFIGHLQSNKVRQIADKFKLIHSVDRLKIAEEISARSTKTQEFLIEVNLAEEESKSGCPVSELPKLIEQVQKLEHLRLKGLMFMPPLNLSEAEQRRYFAEARELRDKMQSQVTAPHSLVELSMGTSHDFEMAIREGATLIRLGTVLFGQRGN